MSRMRRTLTRAICIFSLLAVVVLWPIPLLATNYTVKTGGGGNFATIQACATAAVAGDTCTVYAGSYAGWTQKTSGSAGSPITFTVNPGDTVNITSTVTVTNTNYITIGAPDAGGGCANSGRKTGAGGANPSFTVGGCFIFQNAGIQGPSCGSGNHTNHFHLTYNTSRGIRPPQWVTFAQGSSGGGCSPYVDTTSDDNYFAHNDVNWNIDHPSAPFCNSQFLVYGLRNLFEYNEMQGTGAQHIRVGGSFNVIRSNYAHDDNGNTSLGCGQSPEHIDFFFLQGGDAPAISFSLVESNVWKNCSNDQGNCKFSFARASGADANNTADTVVSRYNYIYNLDGGYAGAGDQSDGSNTTPNWHAYNNTAATEAQNAGSGSCGSWLSGIAVQLNTICYDTTNGQWSPILFSGSGAIPVGSFSDGDLAFTTLCSNCAWNGGTSVYINEATFSALANKTPSFANYPTDGTLQAGSPARNAGVALTAVLSGCGTNLLTVADSRFFQPGWGPNDKSIPADWVQIGSSTTAQITAVNYNNNILTFSSSVACSTGDALYLYKDSQGNVLLNGAKPDIGAYPYTGGTAKVTPPSGLAAVVN